MPDGNDMRPKHQAERANLRFAAEEELLALTRAQRNEWEALDDGHRAARAAMRNDHKQKMAELLAAQAEERKAPALVE